MGNVSVQGPSFYSPKDVGGTLKRMSSDVIQAGGQSVESLWFHSELDADLYVWLDERQNVIKQQLNLFGQVVEWNVLDGVKTGYLEDEESGIEIQGTGKLNFDPTPINSSVKQALDLIAHVGELSEPLRSQLSENLVNAPCINTLDPLEFLRRYGHEQNPYESRSIFAQIIGKIAELFR